jgi:hypothetical protein
MSIPAGILAREFRAIAAATDVPFRVVFPDGTVVERASASPTFTLTFRTRGAELRTVAFGYVGLLESYIDGSLDIDGDFALAVRAGTEGSYDSAPNLLLKLRNRWHEWRFSNRSIAQAKTERSAPASIRRRFGRIFKDRWRLRPWPWKWLPWQPPMQQLPSAVTVWVTASCLRFTGVRKPSVFSMFVAPPAGLEPATR